MSENESFLVFNFTLTSNVEIIKRKRRKIIEKNSKVMSD